ncbi:hypothetical protein B0H17DRAFT_1285028 [Mycena rosella]|uniref:Uncharacterized protein n=1 Tax=Mycena rosella TaxID=1033263 RepID=A0AAD7BSB7_MYCRO|nr:hypothetical protein B0H17DRAFT_1285028 [Mycena rosella]
MSVDTRCKFSSYAAPPRRAHGCEALKIKARPPKITVDSPTEPPDMLSKNTTGRTRSSSTASTWDAVQCTRAAYVHERRVASTILTTAEGGLRVQRTEIPRGTLTRIISSQHTLTRFAGGGASIPLASALPRRDSGAPEMPCAVLLFQGGVGGLYPSERMIADLDVPLDAQTNESREPRPKRATFSANSTRLAAPKKAQGGCQESESTRRPWRRTGTSGYKADEGGSQSRVAAADFRSRVAGLRGRMWCGAEEKGAHVGPRAAAAVHQVAIPSLKTTATAHALPEDPSTSVLSRTPTAEAFFLNDGSYYGFLSNAQVCDHVQTREGRGRSTMKTVWRSHGFWRTKAKLAARFAFHPSPRFFSLVECREQARMELPPHPYSSVEFGSGGDFPGKHGNRLDDSRITARVDNEPHGKDMAKLVNPTHPRKLEQESTEGQWEYTPGILKNEPQAACRQSVVSRNHLLHNTGVSNQCARCRLGNENLHRLSTANGKCGCSDRVATIKAKGGWSPRNIIVGKMCQGVIRRRGIFNNGWSSGFNGIINNGLWPNNRPPRVRQTCQTSQDVGNF